MKRFKLNSIDELPDYDELMAQIAQLNSSILEEEDSNYLYHKDEYSEADDPEIKAERKKKSEPEQLKVTEDGYELPEHLDGDDDVIEIK